MLPTLNVQHCESFSFSREERVRREGGGGGERKEQNTFSTGGEKVGGWVGEARIAFIVFHIYLFIKFIYFIYYSFGFEDENKCELTSVRTLHML